MPNKAAKYRKQEKRRKREAIKKWKRKRAIEKRDGKNKELRS